MANLKEGRKLYFLGLIPNQEVSNKVMELKNYMADHHNCKAPLRSPPHITLYMPFQWREDKEKELIKKLKDFADGQRSFDIILNGKPVMPGNQVISYSRLAVARGRQYLGDRLLDSIQTKWAQLL